MFPNIFSTLAVFRYVEVDSCQGVLATMTGTPRSLSLGTGSSQTMVEPGPTSWQCSVRYLGAAMWLEGDKRLQ